MQATYSPEDNKLRLYPPTGRLDAETYARVKAAGFKWAPRQGLFVAPMWTPGRADLLEELCGEIGDEDTSLTERAEERAERFEEYSEHREADAQRAHDAVSAIADNIPLGQPILVGHHSEKHARRDAERIQNGMRRAVKMWETSQYWTDRAAGAIRHAKYKELPAVRARRIKKIEADKRKAEKTVKQAETFMEMWSKPGLTTERATAIANHDHIHLNGEYWSVWSALDKGAWTAEKAAQVSIEAHERTIKHYSRWIEHYSNRLAYERAMLAASGGLETDRTKPEKGGACKCWVFRGGWSYIQRVNKVSVTVHHSYNEGGRVFRQTVAFDKLSDLMTAAEVQAARDQGRLVECPDKTGFFLSSEPQKPIAPRKDPEATPFDAMRESLKAGVQVVSAPQLFPTPPDLARRMVEAADIHDGQCVLEPSAGTGNLVKAVLDHVDTEVLAYESNESLCSQLRHSFPSYKLQVRCKDFLEVTDFAGCYERIIMNPPFANGADIKHIGHARTFLKPGGRLVAICANGPRQNEKLRPIADTWEELPADTFKAAGTGVRTVMLTITA